MRAVLTGRLASLPAGRALHRQEAATPGCCVQPRAQDQDTVRQPQTSLHRETHTLQLGHAALSRLCCSQAGTGAAGPAAPVPVLPFPVSSRTGAPPTSPFGLSPALLVPDSRIPDELVLLGGAQVVGRGKGWVQVLEAAQQGEKGMMSTMIVLVGGDGLHCRAKGNRGISMQACCLPHVICRVCILNTCPSTAVGDAQRLPEHALLDRRMQPL